MKRKNMARNALFTSIISLLLCVSMLVGTTFAWFTDTVTSGNNVIASGNLDIELDYALFNEDGSFKEWKSVGGSDKLFDDTTLWEPGHTEVVYLRMSNAGSLNLKYQLGINVTETTGINVFNREFKLSDYIFMSVVKDVNAETGKFASRDAARVEAEKGEHGIIGNGYFKPGSMIPAKKEYMAVVVYMPESTDNEANYSTKAPVINLGINLFATQVEAESDSFGQDYDKDAWHTQMEVHNPDDLQTAVNNAESGTVIVLMEDVALDTPLVVPAAEASTYSLRSTSEGIALNLNGKKITTAYDEATGKHQYAIDNYGNLQITGGTIEARGIYNRAGANLTVNGTEIISLDSNGGSSIWSYGGNVVLNNAKLTGYTGCVYSEGNLEINGGTYTCYSGIADDGTQLTPTYNIRSKGNLEINGGSFTSRHGLVAVTGGNAVINGGNFTMTSIGTITSHVVYVNQAGSEVTINGGSFNCDERTAQANGSSLICNTVGATVNVLGGSYNLNPDNYLTEDYKAVETVSGWDVISKDYNYVSDGVLADSNTYYISNRAGFAWMDKQADNFFGNKTIKLTADIDFGGETINSVGFWNSHPTFDGQNYTLSNFSIAQSGMNSSSGLFAGTFNVKNLNVEKASVKGTYAGAISGWMYGNIDNCHVKNSSVVTTFWQGGGLVGQYNNGNVTGCTVENSTISGGSAVGGLIGILNETAGTRKVENCAVKNCNIIKDGGFGGDYDKFFGAAVGLINVENSEIYFSCDVTDTTVKGTASDALYGEDGGNTIYINGEKYFPPKVVEFSGTDIQTALNSLNSGDKLVFPAGTYTTTGTFAVPAGVTIAGKEGETVVLHQDSAAQDDIFNCAGDVVIENITFESNRKGYAIAGNTKEHDTNGNIVVRNCKFVGLATEKNWGIYKNLNGNLTVENCSFNNYNNAICGVNNGDGSTTTITGCTFTNINGEAIGYVSASVPADFEATVIANNTGLTAENVVGY